ncbi:MAG: acyltransferase domain-containing protein, partial [bacterium]|nr:acyltransferase domain-containing protein [bacterium]
MKDGDKVTALVRLTSLVHTKGGIRLSIRGELKKERKTLILLTSDFLVRTPDPLRPFFEKKIFEEATRVEEVPQTDGVRWEEMNLSPTSNESYSLASKDLNPIHTDPLFAAMAGLSPEASGQVIPICHGMGSAALTLSALLKKIPQPVQRWETHFVGTVQPNKELTIEAEHVANKNGCPVFAVVTQQEGHPVLTGRVTFEPKKTAYLFTGQGSQQPRMGMEAYERSEVARSVWDQSDAYCRQKLGFSILEVVRNNPKEILVEGQRISHPKGVLHLTQFTQVGLTVLAMAQTAELKQAGIYNNKASFAGHSLGEYAALSCSGIIPLEEVIQSVYHRGLTMQHFVPRNKEGRSPYGMGVVRPKLVGWSETVLEEKIEALRKKSGEIYLVNYNIEDSQYAVTGELKVLKELEKELTEL